MPAKRRKLDADGDGKVSSEEMVAAEASSDLL